MGTGTKSPAEGLAGRSKCCRAVIGQGLLRWEDSGQAGQLRQPGLGVGVGGWRRPITHACSALAPRPSLTCPPDSVCELLQGPLCPFSQGCPPHPSPGNCHGMAGIQSLLQPSLHSTIAKASSLRHRPIPRPKTAPRPPCTDTRSQPRPPWG